LTYLISKREEADESKLIFKHNTDDKIALLKIS